MLLKRNVNKIG